MFARLSPLWPFSIVISLATQSYAASESEQLDFFESRIRPVLIEHCYKCHNSAETAEADLTLDSRSGLRSETAHGIAVVPGDPAKSLLLKVIRHEIEGLEMPEDSGKLPPPVIADFEKWIQMGAGDPRDQPPSAEELAKVTSWAETIAKRKQWWAFQPISDPQVPVGFAHPIDAFVRSRLQQEGLMPAEQTDRNTLLRRLTFVLTGLPPTRAQIDEFTRAENPVSYEAIIDQLLASQHFGERWARHWMDLVRYTDSHGSEGDPTIPHAYQYRDYLIRALNEDVPYDQLLREHIAGDLLPNPRINEELGLNESAIGTAHWRMVFHGFAPTDALDEKVRFVDDQINVFSKAFLGLTVSCARCHDHKFDAISQQDYYALFGVLGSCRPALRDANTEQRQQTNIEQLQELKLQLREQISQAWLNSSDEISARLLEPSESWLKQMEASDKPEEVLHLWSEMQAKVKNGQTFAAAWNEIGDAWKADEAKADDARTHDNAWYWNLADASDYQDWFADGNGLPSRPYTAGDFSVSDEGDQVIDRILPAGVHTNSISTKHRGFLASKKILLDDDYKVWFYVAGNGEPSVRYSVQHYPRSGTVYPIRNISKQDWYLQDYDLTYWNGDDVHFEIATAKDAPVQVRDKDRSWFSIREVIVRTKDESAPFRNPREFLKPIFTRAESNPPESLQELAQLFEATLRDAIIAWRYGSATDEEAVLLDRWVRAGLLPNDAQSLANVQPLLTQYREGETEIPLPTRVPGLAESEGRDQRLFERGNHKQPTELVERRFLEAIDPTPYQSSNSGRFELAQSLASKDNPLTSRVIVNRLWHYVFGSGIVETPDNFGKLGSEPTHPELLDYLATRFVKEGWSLKNAIKFMLLSKTWQAKSAPGDQAAKVDPQNRLLSHAHLRRLDAEAIRDAMLAISQRLDSTMFGPAVRANSDSSRRSIYIAARRNSLDEFLQVFNAPVPFATKGRRDATNVPAQSLTLLNDPVVKDIAAQWAQSVIADEMGTNREEAITEMFTVAFGRAPQEAEVNSLSQYVSTLQEQFQEQTAARSEISAQIDRIENKLAATLDPIRERLRGERGAADEDFPRPIARWEFETGLEDPIGGLHGEPDGQVNVEGGAIKLNGEAHVATGAAARDLGPKTLVASVQLGRLDQGGGGVITVQTLDGGVFDSIVYGERQPKRWIAGSDGFRRTEDVDGPQEASIDDVLHMAIAYDSDGTIRIYRNGEPYGEPYNKAGLNTYKAGNWQVLFGLRHADANPAKMLSARILDAQIFDTALNAEQIASLALGVDYVSEADVLAALSEQQRQQVDQWRQALDKLGAVLASMGEPNQPNDAWARLAHAILNMKEFIYLR